MNNKIKTKQQLIEITAEEQDKGQCVVFTNGCFDLLHIGHVRYLYRARSLGDLLIVAINSDTSVRSLKGEGRPLITEKERMEVVAALEMVDYVFTFNQLTCHQPLRDIRPDIYVKGGDYTRETLPEWSVVEDYGGRIELVDEVKGRSTSEIIKIIRNESDSSE